MARVPVEDLYNKVIKNIRVDDNIIEIYTEDFIYTTYDQNNDYDAEYSLNCNLSSLLDYKYNQIHNISVRPVNHYYVMTISFLNLMPIIIRIDCNISVATECCNFVKQEYGKDVEWVEDTGRQNHWIKIKYFKYSNDYISCYIMFSNYDDSYCLKLHTSYEIPFSSNTHFVSIDYTGYKSVDYLKSIADQIMNMEIKNYEEYI